MTTATNPGSRPRRGVAIVLSALGVALLVTVAVVAGDADRAQASELAAFTSCAELTEWGQQSQQAVARLGGRVVPTADAVASTVAAEQDAARAAGAEAAGQSTGGTNVVVQGVDELDLVDRVDDDRVLVVSDATLSLVDLTAGRTLATTTVPSGSQITYDAATGVVWVIGYGPEGGTVVDRLAVADAGLEPTGQWTTTGWLVTARRVDDRLHLVAADGFAGPAGEQLPFGGTTVPCDQVLHPIGPSDASATLLVTLPATGDLQPLHSTEVVGSGQLVHVTTEAAYLATPLYEADTLSTSLHRFDLDDLTHTGSGRVAGTLLNDFSMSEHDGYLRVAVTAASPIVPVGRPIPVEGDVTVVEPPAQPEATKAEASTDEALVGPTAPATAPDAVTTDPASTTEPTTTTSTTTTTTEPTTTTTTTEPSTTTTTTTEPTTTTTTTTTTEPTTTTQDPNAPLNQVVVLDTEGDLDVVGTSPRFGHPGETLHGIRFVGSSAYAVTFLQTDPFYVLDLTDPTQPRVAGEVQLPGFSAYLHPVADGLVAGFGPGEEGRATVRLFDVSDPTRPRVADTEGLGDDSPVVYDHHAFVDLGAGRFAVPVTSWSTAPADSRCLGGEGVACPDVAGPTSPSSSVVVLAASGGGLDLEARHTTTASQPATRVIPVGDGWAVLAGNELVLLDGRGGERGRLTL